MNVEVVLHRPLFSFTRVISKDNDQTTDYLDQTVQLFDGTIIVMAMPASEIKLPRIHRDTEEMRSVAVTTYQKQPVENDTKDTQKKHLLKTFY